jgi:protein-tyrosine phosphatase
MLFRGGVIGRLTEDDVKLVESFHLTDIVDFRSSDEFKNHPDHQFENVRYHNLTTFEHELKESQKKHEDGNLLWFMNEGDSGFDHLLRTYKELVSLEEPQEAYRNFFKVLLSIDNNVVYFHCSQGKDRVGLAAYFIETALGVPYQIIKEDYLMSNIAMEDKKASLIKQVENLPFYSEKYKHDLIDVFSAKLEYLEAAIEVLDKEYGGTIPYLEKVLNVDIEKLRAKYLE